MRRDPEIALPTHKFTVEQYHRMGEAGIFPEGLRVELLDGEIIEMSPINSPHAGVVKRLNRILGRYYGDRAIIGIQDPVTLGDFSEPEPEVSVLQPRADFYSGSHPVPDEVIFLIEVADSSVEKDRRVKLPLYAAAGIPEVWIVNLPESVVEVHSLPSPEGFSNIHIFRRGETIRTEHGAELTVEEVIGETEKPINRLTD